MGLHRDKDRPRWMRGVRLVPGQSLLPYARRFPAHLRLLIVRAAFNHVRGAGIFPVHAFALYGSTRRIAFCETAHDDGPENCVNQIVVEIVFWISLGITVYVYGGYPVSIYFLSRIFADAGS